MAEISEEVKDLFHQAYTKLGMPIRGVELTQEMMCDLLKIALGTYQAKVQNSITKNQWASLYGKQYDNSVEMMYALTVRTLDMSKDYSYWFSKEVGLQQRGPWELKKDYFEVCRGVQCYTIPAGREICEVMYCTPSTTKAATFGNIGALDTGIGGGFSQIGNYGGGFGLGGFYVGSAYDSALIATDLKYKNQMIRGDLAYKVTAGPNGTRIVHLMSTPLNQNLIGGIGIDDNWGWNRFAGHYVWYTYYDCANEEDASDCRKQNSNVLISPDKVPFESMQYEMLNEPAKLTVRDLFFAECMITLGIFVRGKFNGKVKIPNAELDMNSSDIGSLGKEEKQKVLEDLKEFLEELSPEKQAEKQKTLAENLNSIYKYKPLGLYVR